MSFLTGQREFKAYKARIRVFLQTAYTDERLAMLLAHAQSGRLAFRSCCCLIGIATADHALTGHTLSRLDAHYWRAEELPGAKQAEIAYSCIGIEVGRFTIEEQDARRRRIIIPMIKAEMRRRSAGPQTASDTALAPMSASASAHP